MQSTGSDESSVDRGAVDTIRRFHRLYTQRIGVLDDSFLGPGRPLGAARVLFEIGPTGAGVRELRARLGLDSGYLSRLLGGLAADGALVVEPDPDDRRRRVARLTASGHAEWIELDRRSDELAGSLVAPLTHGQRARLVAALDLADRLLRAATATIDVVDPASPTASGAMARYFAELDRRFASGFDPGDAVADAATAMTPPDGVFLVARAEATTVACGGLQRVDATTAEIKRMWVHPEWRGAGVGGRLLTALESHAIGLGHRRVVLDTNATLTEAIAMYRAHGYTAIERYNDNPYAQRWFAKALDDADRAVATSRAREGARRD